MNETISINVAIATNEETTTINVEFPYTGGIKDLESFLTNTHLLAYRLGYADQLVDEVKQRLIL
jgi:hypothetical protein